MSFHIQSEKQPAISQNLVTDEAHIVEQVQVSEILKLLEFDYDFEIRTQTKNWKINSMIASTHSNTIYNFIDKGSGSNYLEIDVPDDHFQIIYSYLNGKRDEISQDEIIENIKYVFSVSIQLGIDQAILDLEKRVQISEYFSDFQDAYINSNLSQDTVNLLARRIEELKHCIIENNQNSTTNQDFLYSILSSASCRATPQTTIEIISPYINFAENPNSRFVQFYPFNMIDPEVAVEYLSNVDMNTFREKLQSAHTIS